MPWFNARRAANALTAACLCAGLLALLACGAGKGLETRPDGLESVGAGSSSGSKLPGVEAPVNSAGLPSLEGLSSAERLTSITGPGYRNVPPHHHVRGLNFGEIPNGTIATNGLDPYSFAVYGVSNFPAECYPTDLKVEVLIDPEEEYWVAFADFAAGRWVFNGPFSASVQVEIPFAGQPGGLFDFVSDDRQAFFLVLTQVDSTVNFSSLQLGVHGGESGPSPAFGLEGAGGEGGMLLEWDHSASYEDADFAGYFVERADLLSGSFEALNAEPTFQSNHLDATGVLEQGYRYRVTARDTSGNSSASSVFIGATLAGLDTPPVLVVSYRPGPLEGAKNVTFDFTGSYDPDGTPISSYTVSPLGSPIPTTGLDPLQTVLLHPGCHSVSCTVASNALDTATNIFIKVYPSWQDTPVTVASPQDGTWARLFFGRMRYLQGNEDLAMVGYDTSANALAIWTGNPADGFVPHRVWSVLQPASIEELALQNGQLIIPFTSDFALICMAWNAEEGVIATSSSVQVRATGETRASVVSDGAKVYAVSSTEDAALFNITLTEIFGADDTPVPVMASLIGVDSVAAAYNTGANAIDIVYSDTISTEWLRWSLDSNSMVDSANLSPAPTDFIDIEIDPATGEPAVCYAQGADVRYRAFDGTVWSTQVVLDAALATYAPLDLRYAHGKAYLFCSADTGYCALYERDGGSWTLRNDPQVVPVSAQSASIVPGSAEGEILALDLDDGNDTRLYSLLPGDAHTVIKDFTSRPAVGLQMRGAPGSDGLHVVFIDRAGKPYHYVGDNNGSGWVNRAMPWNFVTSIDIGSQNVGEVYVSLNNPDATGAYQLEYWNPTTDMFVNEIAPIVGDPEHHPFMSWSPLAETVGWHYFDGAAGQIHHDMTNQTSGPSGNFDTLGTDPVWRGAGATSTPRFIALLYGGMDPWDGDIVLQDPGSDQVDELFGNLFASGPPFDLTSSFDVTGRTIDGCIFLKRLDLGVLGGVLPAEAYAFAQGPLFNPTLAEIDFLGNRQMHFSESSNFLTTLFQQDLRRSTSVVEAPGATGVVLTASLDASYATLSWSNYGEWEDLPLPPDYENMSRPELICSSDGRWHIIYHDWVTDAIKCLSTEL